MPAKSRNAEIERERLAKEKARIEQSRKDLETKLLALEVLDGKLSSRTLLALMHKSLSIATFVNDDPGELHELLLPEYSGGSVVDQWDEVIAFFQPRVLAAAERELDEAGV